MSSDPSVASPMTALMEGYYVVRLLDAFRKNGLLDRLSPGATIYDLSMEFGCTPDRITVVLDYLALRSDVVCKTKSGYSVDVESPETQFALHLLDQYAGAYGPCLDAMPDILARKVNGAALVDRARHAAAFAWADQSHMDPDTLRLLSELRIDTVIDLGCGTGGFVVEFASRNSAARCVGIDSSAAAIRIARERIAKNGFSDRVLAIEGDVRKVDELLSTKERDAVQCVVAVNVANAFFNDPSDIDLWLRTLKAAFPNRIMLLGDYFGNLGHSLEEATIHQRGLFHDIAQLLSDQGVPPCRLEQWIEVLERNSCVLIRAFEGTGGDMKRFILLVQL